METTLTAIASSLGGMLALLTGQRMWARRNGRPDYYHAIQSSLGELVRIETSNALLLTTIATNTAIELERLNTIIALSKSGLGH